VRRCASRHLGEDAHRARRGVPLHTFHLTPPKGFDEFAEFGFAFEGWLRRESWLAAAFGSVSALSRVTEHIDVFTVGSDGIVYGTWWDGATGWANWFQLAIT
jgi:hypothetical protein